MPAGQNAVGAVAIVWDQPNAGGPTGSGYAAVAGTGQAGEWAYARYDAWDYYRLLDFGLVPGAPPPSGAISSVTVFTPIVGATTVILYTYGPGIFSLYNTTHFDYNFLILDNRSGDRVDINLADMNIHDGTWDNCVTSMIVAHTAQGDETRIRASELTPLWNAVIDPQLASAAEGVVTSVARDGDPVWNWVPFPNISGLNPSQVYLSVYQPLEISLVDPLPDYGAYIRYYLRLFAGHNTVTGHVDRWEYWVEGGLLSDYVKAVLRPYTMLGAEMLDTMLASGDLAAAFAVTHPELIGRGVRRLYYLPGDQHVKTANGQFRVTSGFTQAGNPTIVLQTT